MFPEVEGMEPGSRVCVCVRDQEVNEPFHWLLQLALWTAVEMSSAVQSVW